MLSSRDQVLVLLDRADLLFHLRQSFLDFVCLLVLADDHEPQLVAGDERMLQAVAG